jgi:hypothetical protein
MDTAISLDPQTEIDYPDSDGKPMSDNTLQFEWIMRIKGGLDIVFANDPDVFVAGDLLWYPVRGTAINSPGVFVDKVEISRGLLLAQIIIDLLEQIENDPTRLTTAIADLRTRWP